MKYLTCVSLMVVSFGFVTVTAQTKSASGAGEAGIRNWLNQFTKAFTDKNIDGIMALYADDVVAYDVVPPLQNVGKEAYRKDIESFLRQYEGNLRFEVRDLHVGVKCDLGYATGLELISGTLKSGQKSEVWLRFTSLFRKANGQWLDFHDHISVPADIESGKAMLELKP
jgi:ketosteroid isomerase-like protein